MLIKKTNAKFKEDQNARGGVGKINLFQYISEANEKIDCKKLSFLSMVILEPGSSIGEHRHDGNFECYFITDGHGEISDCSEKHLVQSGDLLITKSGQTHSITNLSNDKKLTMVAFICEM